MNKQQVTGFFRFFSLISFLGLLAACTQTTTPLPLPDQTIGEWVEFKGATDTICANGSDFKYFVNKGSINKVVIEFEGGGACWDDASCLAGASANSSQTLYTDFVASSPASLNTGLHDHSNAANPVKDWYHVYIPYCTGDLHIGNNSKSYTNPVSQTPYKIEHKGAVNAKSVIDWAFETFKDPEGVFVAGCSAGAYGAAFWTDAIKSNYPTVDTYQLGDCGVGASIDAFATLSTTNWNAAATFPGTTFDKNFVNTTYISTANKFKDSLNMTQYNTLFDQTQISFYGLITGQTDPAKAQQVAAEWSGIMQTSLASITAQATNFNSFTAQGSQHCIITSNDFYTREESGTKLVTWLTDYLEGKSVPNVLPAP